LAETNENNLLRDAFVRHQIGLLRVSAGQAEIALEILDSSENRLRVLIEQFLTVLQDKRVDLTSTAVRSKLDALRRRIEAIRSRAMSAILEQMEDDARETVIAQWAWLGLTLDTITAGRIHVESPGRARLAREMVSKLPFEGRTLRQWVRDTLADDVQRIHDTITTGLVQDQSKRTILQSVLGTARMDGGDGQTHRTRHFLRILIRTSNTHFAAQAVDAMTTNFARDLYVAVLDGATTAICRGLDGGIYRQGEGPMPPVHHGCRSHRQPIIPGQPAPTRIGYQDWMRTQPPAFQDKVLGKVQGKLFRAGNFPLPKFIDYKGDPFTQAQLARFNRQAFIDAGLDPDKYTS